MSDKYMTDADWKEWQDGDYELLTAMLEERLELLKNRDQKIAKLEDIIIDLQNGKPLVEMARQRDELQAEVFRLQATGKASCCDEHRRMKQPRSKEKVPPMKNKAKEDCARDHIIQCVLSAFRKLMLHRLMPAELDLPVFARLMLKRKHLANLCTPGYSLKVTYVDSNVVTVRTAKPYAEHSCSVPCDLPPCLVRKPYTRRKSTCEVSKSLVRKP
jgi:hypothetical protein